MKIIYTLQTQLFVKNTNGVENLLTTDSQNIAYNTLEEAEKALQDLKQYHLSVSEYKPLVGDSNGLYLKSKETEQIFRIEFKINQFLLKES